MRGLEMKHDKIHDQDIFVTQSRAHFKTYRFCNHLPVSLPCSMAIQISLIVTNDLFCEIFDINQFRSCCCTCTFLLTRILVYYLHNAKMRALIILLRCLHVHYAFLHDYGQGQIGNSENNQIDQIRIATVQQCQKVIP